MRVLYLEGDPCSPKYVAGTMRALGMDVQQVVDAPYDGPFVGHDVVVLSDYPADTLGEAAAEALADAVASGTGLSMVGGWTSMGRGGYATSPLSRVLPVALHDGDDRVRRPSGAFLVPARAHPLVEDWDAASPPVVTGWNRVDPVSGATVLLEARSVARVEDDQAVLDDERAPILVVAERDDAARVAVLATDLAPHWSGGWTDHGARMVDVGEGEEVGTDYLRFVGRLLAWCARSDPPALPREAVGRARP